MRAISVSTPGLMCNACTSIVERSLTGLEGVVSVTATLEGNTTSILFDETRVDAVQIITRMAEAGFEAILL